MDKNTIFQLALVFLAKKEQDHRKMVALQLLKAIVSNTNTDLENIDEISNNLKALIEVYYAETDDESLSKCFDELDYVLQNRFEIEGMAGISDKDEDTSMAATIIEAFGGTSLIQDFVKYAK